MKILGLDPGTARVGWGVIDGNRNTPKAVAYGCITTAKSDAPEKRLLLIHKQLGDIIRKHKPEAIAVERLFFSSNVTTAFAVGEARGVILLAAAQGKVPVISYTPQAVKQAVAGHGRAEKRQIQKMITLILHLPEIPKPDDTADALAIALTHAVSQTFARIKQL